MWWRLAWASLVGLAGCSFDGGGLGAGGDGAPEADATRDASLSDAAAAPLFSYGFEEGLQGPFSGTYELSGDHLALESSEAYSGSFAARATSDGTPASQAAFYLDLSPLREEVRFAAAIYLDEGFPPDQRITLLEAANTLGPMRVNAATVHVEQDMRVSIYSPVDDQLYLSSTALAADTWYLLEAKVVVEEGEGSLALWIDGEQEILETGIDTGGTDVEELLFGLVWQHESGEALEVLLDDVRVDR